jgi:putative ABC transport system permease protein
MKSNNTTPPRWADRFLKWALKFDSYEEVSGDLHEAFLWRASSKGPGYAKWMYTAEVIKSIRFYNIKPIAAMNHYLIMYKSYLKTGWRFLMKNKFYGTLNIMGLALGISFCWLAYLYANDEMSYDKHLDGYERLYRIVMDMNHGDVVDQFGGSSNAMSVYFRDNVPEISAVARIKTGFGLVLKEEEVLKESFLYADRTLFDLIDMEFTDGNPGTFDLPNDIVISESMASKLSLSGEAVGSILSLNESGDAEDFIVRAVFKDIPENTSVRSHVMVSYTNYESHAPERRLTTWMDINMNTLIQLQENVEKSQVVEKMNLIQAEMEEDPELKNNVKLGLQPITEIHLDTVYGHYNGIARGGNNTLIKLFAVIGIFCLVISMINYSNFNISLYINRSREVALRKVVGAGRHSIFSQLITESVLSSLFAGVFGVLLLVFILPYFSSFVSKSYELSFLLNAKFLVGAVIILLGTAFVSGVYPAFVLSRFSIVKSLKGEQKIRSGKWITQTLLGTQFVIATVLIAGMLTLRNQISFLTSFDTKLDYNQVLYIDDFNSDDDRVKAFMNDLEQLPEVSGVASTSGYNGTRLKMEEDEIRVRHLRVDHDLMQLLDIDIVNGRNFDPAISSDATQAVLINQALADRLGMTSPIGEVVPFDYGDLKNPKIIGVVEDYHFQSAKSIVEPLVIYQSPQYQLQNVYIKLSEGTLFNPTKFEAVWKKHFSPFPLNYSFLEDEYTRAYAAEQRMMQLVTIGCFVSIFLAAMGLLGIVGLQLNQKLKEISIRKVLGARPNQLYQLFTQRFLIVIATGLALGMFVSHQLINEWLSSYPYRVEFGAEIILMTIGIALFIGVSTVLSQVFKAVRANPVRYLKDE